MARARDGTQEVRIGAWSKPWLFPRYTGDSALSQSGVGVGGLRSEPISDGASCAGVVTVG